MSSIPRNFGGYLRILREGLGLSRNEVGYHTNLTEEDVKLIEAGIKPIPPLTITPWADILRINPHLFITMMINVEIKRICLNARLPYLFKVVPLDEDEQIHPETSASFAYPHRGGNNEG